MSRSSARNTATAVVSGLAMALLVIMVHQKIMGYDQEGCSTPRWTSTNHSDDGLTLRQRAGRCKLEVDLRGDMRWSPSEDAVEWLAPGGKFDVEERLPEVRHRLRVRPGDGGAPRVEYWRDGDEMAIDATGRAWMHRVAMQLFRRAGIDAEERSRRLMEAGGVDALLDEMDEIDSDHVAALYARAAFDADDDELAAVLRTVARRVGSDHSVAELLVDLAEHRAASPPTSETFLRALDDALKSLGSDHDLRRSVVAFLSWTGAQAAESAETLVPETVLRSATHYLGSDYEAARTLAAYAEEVGDGRPLTSSAFDLLRTVDSDYSMRQTLITLAQGGRTAEDVRRLLSISHAMGSDYDMAEWLIALSGTGVERIEVDDALRSALATIGSDFERRRVEEAWDGPVTPAE